MFSEIDREFGKELCTILGLDASTISRISITQLAGELPEVIIKRRLTVDDRKKLMDTIEEYELVKKPKLGNAA